MLLDHRPDSSVCLLTQRQTQNLGKDQRILSAKNQFSLAKRVSTQKLPTSLARTSEAKSNNQLDECKADLAAKIVTTRHNKSQIAQPWCEAARTERRPDHHYLGPSCEWSGAESSKQWGDANESPSRAHSSTTSPF